MNRMFAISCLIAALVPALAQAQFTVQGTTRFAKLVELHAEQSGLVARVAVEETDRVASGDVLVELANGIQAARVQVAQAAANAEATILRAQAILEQTQSRLKRIQRAASRGGAPKWEVAEARLAVRAAEAELAGAREQAVASQARLELEIAGMEEYLVRAPFDGDVLEVNAIAGMLADGRTPLLVLADRSEIEILTFLPAAAAFALKQGDILPVTLGNPVSRSFSAVLVNIDPRIEPASGTVRAVLRLENPDTQIPAGIEVAITLPGEG